MEETQQAQVRPGLGRSAPSFRLRSHSLNTLRLRRVFDVFDNNKDGEITVAELMQALARLGLEADAAELGSTVAAFIRAGHAGLEFEDFEGLHRTLGDALFGVAAEGAGETGADAEAEESDLVEAFSVFDEDGDGFISAAELQAVLRKLGLPQAGNIADVRQMICSVDSNHDGQVDFWEMSETVEQPSLMEKISEKIHDYKVMDKISEKIHEYKGDSSSSDSEEEGLVPKKKRLFGRQEPVHTVLGGGKYADIILWRNKQITAGILLSGTVIWLLFEWMGYHLLTLMCHSLIFALAVLFLWSNASSFVNISPPKFPEVILPEDMFLDIARTLRHEINEAFFTFRYVASGKDLKQFLLVILGLWVMSVVGSWFNFLTLFYIIFVIMYTVPVLYEKHEDHVDTVAERAMLQVNKHYAVLDEKVLQKIPKAGFLGKKQN